MQGAKIMKKPIAAINKIELKFMDVSVKLTGSRNIEKKALSLLGALIQDRFKVYEMIENIDHEAEEAEIIHKKKKILPDIEFMRGYA